MRTDTESAQPRVDASIIDYIERTAERMAQKLAGVPAREYVDNREAARLMSITPDTLSLMRARGEGPPWSGSRKMVRYAVRDINKWLAALPRLEG